MVLPAAPGEIEGGVFGTMVTTALGSLLAVLAGLLHDLAQFALSLSSPSGSSGLNALAAAVLAGAILTAVLALIASVATVSGLAAIPLIRRSSALREKSWRAAFLRQRDPDAPGRARPRAPSAAQAAATSR